MADDGGFAPPPTGQKLVALHKCVQGCPAQQQFQPSFPGQAQFPGQTAIALGPPPPIGKFVLVYYWFVESGIRKCFLVFNSSCR